MIFNKLFSPSYKSNDPDKRLASILNLNPNSDKDKSVLHELAFNDGDDNVALAALDKLDSFVLWIKSAETAESVKIRKAAFKKSVELLSNNEVVADDMFISIVEQSSNKPMLEHLLFNSKRLNAHPDLALKTVFSLQNEPNVRRFFQHIANETQQSTIVDATTDSKALAKLAKLTKYQSVIDAIESKLQHLMFLQEKPIKIKQQMTLLNSRLFALQDAKDYEYIEAKKRELEAEFETLKTDFGYLDDISKTSLCEKFLSIKHVVEQRLKKLEGDYIKQKSLQSTTNELAQINDKCSQIQAQIDLLISTSIPNSSDEKDECLTEAYSGTESELKILSLALSDAEQELNNITLQSQTQAHQIKIKDLHKYIGSMQTHLQNLPLIMQKAEKLAKLGDEISTFLATFDGMESLEHQALQGFVDQCNDFAEQGKQIQQGQDIPQSVQAGYIHISKTMQNRLKQFTQYYKQLEKKCESKLKAVNKMIRDGKFKPAISTFYHVQKIYEQLHHTVSPRIEKAYEQTLSEIHKLQELQAYIAAPRKPALLEQAQKLAKSEFTDPYQRAASVKQLRKDWTSLGNLYTPQDDEHNKAFDQAIEKAYVPCRVFFAELDKQHDLAYQQGVEIVKAIQQLDLSLSLEQLVTQTNKLKSRFSQLNEMEKNKHHQLKRQYNKALKPINELIQQDHGNNAQQKQSLINKAKKLQSEAGASYEALKEIVSQAKSLQLKWKQVGFAGKAQDGKLWQAFREINDDLFARYHDTINAAKLASSENLQALDGQLKQLSEQVAAAKSLAELQFFEPSHATLIAQIGEADERTKKVLRPKLAKLENVYNQVVHDFNKARANNALKSLFTFLKTYQTHEDLQQQNTIQGRYKTWLQGDVNRHSLLVGLDRVALTQIAAIIHDVKFDDINIGTQATRKSLQLKLMASKLQGDEVLGPEDVLAAWVQMGPVNADEADSLAALEKIYVQ